MEVIWNQLPFQMSVGVKENKRLPTLWLKVLMVLCAQQHFTSSNEIATLFVATGFKSSILNMRITYQQRNSAKGVGLKLLVLPARKCRTCFSC